MILLRILLGISILGFCLQPTFAQTAKPSAKMGAAKKDPRAALRLWDANKDGRLDKSEIPEEHRAKVYGAAKMRGMNLKQPLEIKKLFEKPTEEQKGKQAKREAKKAEKAERKKAESAAKQNTKAFGQSASKQKTAPDENSSTDNESKEKRDALRGARFAAKSLMFQNDKNKNNRLERSEWSRLKGNPAAADKNKDGSLSMSELTDHLAGYGSREDKPRRRPSRAESGTNNSQRKSYRFLTPHERLPDGLPDWFVERDTNFDGQISLKEFAPSLTAAKYEKFVQLDLNKDGMLLAKEYLAATQ